MISLRSVLLGFLLFLIAQPLLGQTYYVGSCEAGSFTTISAAVAAVPAGSTVAVCPGYYPEQVVISKELTLRGMQTQGTSLARIAVPTAGLATTTSIVYGTVTAQLEVLAGRVNVMNISIDGHTASNCPTSPYIGIMYDNGTTGTVTEVSTSNQNCNDLGIGILAENAGTTNSITIRNSNIESFSKFGIQTVCTCDQNSAFTATVKGNYVFTAAQTSAWAGIELQNVKGTASANIVNVNGTGIDAECGSDFTVSGNIVSGGFEGISMLRAGTVTGNTITGNNMQYGIFLWRPAGVIVEQNNVASASTGIWLNGFTPTAKATVQSNVITNAQVAIEFNCSIGEFTISGNSINSAGIGMDDVPDPFPGANKFYNVGMTRGGFCP